MGAPRRPSSCPGIQRQEQNFSSPLGRTASTPAAPHRRLAGGQRVGDFRADRYTEPRITLTTMVRGQRPQIHQDSIRWATSSRLRALPIASTCSASHRSPPTTEPAGRKQSHALARPIESAHRPSRAITPSAERSGDGRYPTSGDLCSAAPSPPAAFPITPPVSTNKETYNA